MIHILKQIVAIGLLSAMIAGLPPYPSDTKPFLTSHLTQIQIFDSQALGASTLWFKHLTENLHLMGQLRKKISIKALFILPPKTQPREWLYTGMILGFGYPFLWVFNRERLKGPIAEFIFYALRVVYPIALLGISFGIPSLNTHVGFIQRAALAVVSLNLIHYVVEILFRYKDIPSRIEKDLKLGQYLGMPFQEDFANTLGVLYRSPMTKVILWILFGIQVFHSTSPFHVIAWGARWLVESYGLQSTLFFLTLWGIIAIRQSSLLPLLNSFGHRWFNNLKLRFVRTVFLTPVQEETFHRLLIMNLQIWFWTNVVGLSISLDAVLPGIAHVLHTPTVPLGALIATGLQTISFREWHRPAHQGFDTAVSDLSLSSGFLFLGSILATTTMHFILNSVTFIVSIVIGGASRLISSAEDQFPAPWAQPHTIYTAA